tara:strand:- start:857 stop:1339 length:483 start_codon:yes stop_codon:yes gene_type:complete
MFVVEAKCEHDVENDIDHIALTYLEFTPGTMYSTHTKFVYSTPKGDWTHLTFTLEDYVKVYDFVDTMIHPTLETVRLVARAYHSTLLGGCRASHDTLVQLAHAVRILDPTFKPPLVNERASWQRDILELIANESSIRVLSTCRNYGRLAKYCDALRGMLL